MSSIGYLRKRMTASDFRNACGPESRITVNIAVDFYELVDGDIEWLNDEADRSIVPEGLVSGLMDLAYTPIGVDGSSVIVAVDADASAVLDELQEDDE